MVRSLWFALVMCSGIAVGAKPNVQYTWNMLVEEGLTGVTPAEQQNAVLLVVNSNLTDEATQVTLQSLFNQQFEIYCMTSSSSAECLHYISAIPGQVCSYEMTFLLSYPVKNSIYYGIVVQHVCQEQASYIPPQVLLDFFRNSGNLHADLKISDARALRNAPQPAEVQVAATVAQSHHVLLQISNQLSEPVQPAIQEQFNSLFVTSCNAELAKSQCQFYLPPPNEVCSYVVDMTLLEHYKSGTAELYLTSAALLCETSNLQLPASVLIEYFSKVGKLHQTFTILKIHELPAGVFPVLLPRASASTTPKSTSTTKSSLVSTTKPKSIIEQYLYYVVLGVTSELSPQIVAQNLQTNFDRLFAEFCRTSVAQCSAYVQYLNKSCSSRLHINRSFMYQELTHYLVSADFLCGHEVTDIPASLLTEFFNQAAYAHAGLTIDSASTLHLADMQLAAAGHLAQIPNADAVTTALMMAMTRLQPTAIKGLLETFTNSHFSDFCLHHQHAVCEHYARLSGENTCLANVTIKDSYLMQQTKVFAFSVQLHCGPKVTDIPTNTLISFFNVTVSIDPNFIILGIYYLPHGQTTSTTASSNASVPVANATQPATAYVTATNLTLQNSSSAVTNPQLATDSTGNTSTTAGAATENPASNSNSAVTSAVATGSSAAADATGARAANVTSSAASAASGVTSSFATKDPAATSGIATGSPAATSGAASAGPGATSAVATAGPGATSAVATAGPGATSAVATAGPGATSAVATAGPGATSAVATAGPGGATSSAASAAPGATSGIATGNPGATSGVATGNPGATSGVATGAPGGTSGVVTAGPGATSGVATGAPGGTSGVVTGRPLATSGSGVVSGVVTSSTAKGVTSAASGGLATGSEFTNAAFSTKFATQSVSNNANSAASKSVTASSTTSRKSGSKEDDPIADYIGLLVNSTLSENEIETRLENDLAPLFKGFCESDGDGDGDDDDEEDNENEKQFCGMYLYDLMPQRLRFKRQVRIPQCQFNFITVNVSHPTAELTQMIGYIVLVCNRNNSRVVPSAMASHFFTKNSNRFPQMHIASAFTVAATNISGSTASPSVTTNANEQQTNVVYLTTVVYDNTYFIATICLGVISSILLVVILTYLGHYCLVGRYEREALVQLLRSVTTRRHYGTIDSPDSSTDYREGRNNENAKIFQY